MTGHTHVCISFLVYLSCVSCSCSCAIRFPSLHTKHFMKRLCYFLVCFPTLVSNSSDSLCTDVLLRLLLVCNVITSSWMTGRKLLPWGGSHETREFLHVWSDLINSLRIRGPSTLPIWTSSFAIKCNHWRSYGIKRKFKRIQQIIHKKIRFHPAWINLSNPDGA